MGTPFSPDERSSGNAEQREREVISDPSEIQNYLKQAQQEQEKVEIQIGNSPRIFYAHLLKKEQKNIQETPASNLIECHHFLLTPMVPAIGNALVRNSDFVVVRFFRDIRAVEFKAHFAGVVTMNDQPTIQLSFPKAAYLTPKRRHFRTKSVGISEVRLGLYLPSLPGLSAYPMQIIDMSAGGVAFSTFDMQAIARQHNSNSADKALMRACSKMPLDRSTLPLNEEIELELCSLNQKMPSIKLMAKVCHHTKLPGNIIFCGLQFDLVNHALSSKVSRFVTIVQREWMNAMKSRHSQASATNERKRKRLTAKNRSVSKKTKKESMMDRVIKLGWEEEESYSGVGEAMNGFMAVKRSHGLV